MVLSKKELDRVSVVQRLERKEIKQSDAARLLNRSVRQIKRLLRSYRLEGEKGLISKRRGRPSNNRLSEKLRRQIPKLIAEQYADFGPTLASEKLESRHQIQVSVESIRQLMIEHQLWSNKRRRGGRVFQLRVPRPCVGEMIQMDGSPHAWFEERGPSCCLIVFIDDASSRILMARFWPHETTEAYMVMLKHYLTRYGRPVSMYSDRHSIFRPLKSETGMHFTQFGRVLETLDIEAIHAQTPQAKGRVERANKTLQDRLVKELRLENICTMADANDFLDGYLSDYNKRFAKPPRIDTDVHRKVLHNKQELELIFSLQFQRVVSKSLQVQYNKTVYQINAPKRRHQLAHKTIIVCEQFDGEVTLLWQGKPLDFKVYQRGQAPTEVENEKTLNARVDRALHHQKQTSPSKPSVDHPWRRYRGLARKGNKYDQTTVSTSSE